MSSRFLQASVPIGFAHRGFADDGLVENTMPAFQRAVELGYLYLETDVRVTSDDVAVAFHDSLMRRLSTQAGGIEDLSYAQVRRVSLGERAEIPRLDDLLGAWPDRFVNIDVKCDAAVDPTVAAIRAAQACDRVCVAAFSARRLRRLRGLLGAQVCTALTAPEAVRLRVGTLAPARRPRAAQVPYRVGPVRLVDRRFIAAARRSGVAVHVWTVNDPADMRAALDAGVDGIMTDRADLLRDELRKRGAWPSR